MMVPVSSCVIKEAIESGHSSSAHGLYYPGPPHQRQILLGIESRVDLFAYVAEPDQVSLMQKVTVAEND